MLEEHQLFSLNNLSDSNYILYHSIPQICEADIELFYISEQCQPFYFNRIESDSVSFNSSELILNQWPAMSSSSMRTPHVIFPFTNFSSELWSKFKIGDGQSLCTFDNRLLRTYCRWLLMILVILVGVMITIRMLSWLPFSWHHDNTMITWW